MLWNVFLFVICGGSLIYGFVQQQRVTESRIRETMIRAKADSLNVQLNKCIIQTEQAQMSEVNTEKK